MSKTTTALSVAFIVACIGSIVLGLANLANKTTADRELVDKYAQQATCKVIVNEPHKKRYTLCGFGGVVCVDHGTTSLSCFAGRLEVEQP